MRKLATAAAVSLALASGGAFGLGLGDIEMRSALNQPMNAEIRLTSVKSGELEGMIVQLASPDAFARAGIERSTALTDLQFTVDTSSGVPVIRIISRKPVIEPFLNFLLEVDWPQGRMVREYTVLLDPPVFMTPTATERNTTADQPAVVDRGTEALVVPTPIERNAGTDGGLGDLADESAADAASSTAAAEASEGVALDALPDNALLADSEPQTLAGGDVVALTDLASPNQDAEAEREAQAAQQAALDNISVELFGAGEEVSDSTVIDENDEIAPDGSVIVSLDELTAPEERSGTAASSTEGQGSEVSVGRGDTLYEIAQDNASAGISVQQMMMALLAANESAFINKNINLVKAGSILRVPDIDEATRLSQRQALAAIGQQNQLWQEYRDKLQNSGATRTASGNSTRTPAIGGEPASDTTAIDTAAFDPASTTEDAAEKLSTEAQAILDTARNEISGRDELRLVADNAPTSTTASATADETQESEAARLGEVNRKLQLAREELSSTRLQADELSDQAGELQGTTQNLDSLVTLRQNEIAQLEAQLLETRELAEEAASRAATDTGTNAADQDEATNDEASASSSETVAEGTGADVEGNAVADSGDNTLTDEGESTADDAQAVVAPPAVQTTWYQDLMNDPKRLAIAGVGAVGLLGVLGTLMFRRKRRGDRDDELLDIVNEHGFDNEQDAATLPGDTPTESAGNVAPAVAGTAAAVAASGAVADPESKKDLDKTFENLIGNTSKTSSTSLPLSPESPVSTGNMDQDDTLSEVEVYLAYGLHGQAEELLSKATQRDPDNQAYARKLIQTYHAQGNGDGFHSAASNFHERFGGESNSEWASIAAMGAELRPRDELYASGHDSVSRVGAGHSDGSALSDDDFLPAQDNDDGSVSRDFQSGGDAVDFEDEAPALDQSLDPAFAFDESDLEATGDFSSTADDVAAEADDGSIDFTGFETTETGEELPADVNLEMPGDLTSELSADLTDANDPLGDALTIDELDRVASVDDLTLDLDQLSGDLELDSSELMNADLSDLDLPDLTIDNDLFGDNVSMGDNADEMDTMLDLAKAYIDMGDKDSASSALDEIVKSGSPAQVSEAETLLRKIS